MYTKYKYSVAEVLVWTRLEIVLFVVLSTVAVFLFQVVGLRWLQIPWTPVALVGTAVAFLIGFQHNAAYGRAWEARKIWGGIVNTSRTWTMMVRDMITNEHVDAEAAVSEEELAKQRTQLIHRHIAWLTALRHAMRARKKWEVFIDHRTNNEWHEKICIPERDIQLKDDLQPLLEASELDHVLETTNKSAAILALQSNHLRRLQECGLLWQFSFLELENILKELFDLQGKSERIKNFPYPRHFATLGYDLVKIFVLLLPFGVIPEFAKVGESLGENFPLIGGMFVWLAIPFTVIVSWVFNTMQRIGTSGENPFEGSANDVPISTIARAIEIDLREMNGEPASDIPEPLCEIHNVQM